MPTAAGRAAGALDQQSPDIAQGGDAGRRSTPEIRPRPVAPGGDQAIMFGCRVRRNTLS